MTTLAMNPGALPVPPMPAVPGAPIPVQQAINPSTTLRDGVALDPLLTVKKGDTVIWMRGGQEAYSDGTLAFVSNVYIGGEGVDLLVPGGTGVLETRSLVQHVSEKDEVPDNRKQNTGLWMFKEEHHLILQNDRVERDRRKAEQLQRQQQGESFKELGHVG